MKQVQSSQLSEFYKKRSRLGQGVELAHDKLMKINSTETRVLGLDGTRKQTENQNQRAHANSLSTKNFSTRQAKPQAVTKQLDSESDDGELEFEDGPN